MVRIRVPRKYGVQREIELERARQNADFNRRLKNAEESMKAIYPEEYKKIRSRYFGSGNNLGLIGSQYNYIHDMITRRSDDQMKKYYNELNDYFIKQTGTEPGYMLPGVDVNDEAPDWMALRQNDFNRFYSPTENSDYLNTVEKENARNAYLALQNKNADGTFDHDGYFDYDHNNGLLNTEANYARAQGSYNYTPEERKAAATWERAQNSPIITAMEFSPLFPVVAGVKAVAAANAPQAGGVDVGMNTAFAALPAVGAGVKAINNTRKLIRKPPQITRLALNSDDRFIQGQNLSRSLDKTSIAPNVDAHGISKGNELERLETILSKGIDKNKEFFSAPLAKAEGVDNIGQALGTSGGTAYTDGMFILASKPNKHLIDDGIDAVLINTADTKYAKELKKYLTHKYPNTKFLTYEEAPKYYGAKWNPIEEIKNTDNAERLSQPIQYGSVDDELPPPPDEVNYFFNSGNEVSMPSNNIEEIELLNMDNPQTYVENSIPIDDKIVAQFKIHGDQYIPQEYRRVEKGISGLAREHLDKSTIDRNLYYLKKHKNLDTNGENNLKDVANKLLDDVEIGKYSGEDYRLAGEEKTGGFYDPATNFISINKDSGYKDYEALGHEGRHMLDYKFPYSVTGEQREILNNAFDEDFIQLPNKVDKDNFLYKYPSIEKEAVTTNFDARRKLLGDQILNKPVELQNDIIDKISDHEIINAIANSNRYGKEYIKYLMENNKLTQQKIKQFREAMKWVGAISIPIGIGLNKSIGDNEAQPQFYKSGGIHINHKNEGKFTESANRAGMGVQEYARHILANKENYSPTMVRRANFARNASKWKHDDGGSIPPYYKSFDEWYNSLYQNNDTTDYNLRRAYELAPTEELENWKIAPETNHLHTVYWNGDEYEFMKKRNHPTLKNELDWYNSKDGADFRMRYSLDTTGDTYRYVPRYKVRIVEP